MIIHLKFKEGAQMNSRWMRTLAGILILGLAFWGPGMSMALAQVEITPEIRDACETFPPELRDIALNEVVPKLEEASRPDASPEAQAEVKVVETTAVAIRQTTETTKKALENPEALAKNAVEALAKSGVPTEVTGKIEAQMKDALAKAAETLKSGGNLEDAAKYFEVCKNAMAECSGYLGDKSIREVFAAGGTGGFERGEFHSMEFLGSVVDPGQRDVIEACMKAHFESSFREMALQGGTEGSTGLSPEAMKGMMEQMSACGISPREVFYGGPGEFYGTGPTSEYLGPGGFTGPSPEAIAAMTPEQKAGYEAWKSGDFAKMSEIAMQDAYKAGAEVGMYHDYAGNVISAETMFREMATSGTVYVETVYRDTTTPTQEAPRTETSGTSQTTFEQHYVDGHPLCPAGKTHVEGVSGGNAGHCI